MLALKFEEILRSPFSFFDELVPLESDGDKKIEEGKEKIEEGNTKEGEADVLEGTAKKIQEQGEE